MTLTDSAFSRDGEGESSALPLQKNPLKKTELLRLSKGALLRNQIGQPSRDSGYCNGYH